MKHAILLCLLLAPADVDADRKALGDALTVGKAEPVQAALLALTANDDERTADALSDSYEKAVDLLRSAQKDVTKYAKEMEDSKVVYDAQGRFIKGKADVYMKAEEQWNFARGRVATVDWWAPKIAFALLDLKTDKQLAGLLKLFKTGSNFYIRGCAAFRLGTIASKEATDALVASLQKENDATMRVALLDAVGGIAKDNAIVRDCVLEALKSGEWQVVVAACGALRAAPFKGAAQPLVAALKGMTGRLRSEINNALKTVTGVDKHGDYEAWKAWWDEHGAEFLEGTYVPHPSEQADAKGVSAFYGVPVVSTRLVFLIDTSASMQEKPGWLPPDFAASFKGEANRLDVARFELKKIIGQLPNNCEFNIVNFHSFLVPYAEKLVRMDSGQRTKALKWIDALPMGDGTHTWDGLEECFRQAGGNFFVKNASGALDTIYLMSDGVPSSGVQDLKQFREKIVAMTRFKKIVIHTIAVDPPPGGEDLLKAVAEASGGTCVRR
jgi:HEAT repeat protein